MTFQDNIICHWDLDIGYFFMIGMVLLYQVEDPPFWRDKRTNKMTLLFDALNLYLI
jgi:hypothetical protein